jgi:hypothetical protein
VSMKLDGKKKFADAAKDGVKILKSLKQGI